MSSIRFDANNFVKLRKEDITKYYDVQRIIGEGSYGKVWQVIDHVDSNLIIKLVIMIKRKLAGDETNKESLNFN